MCPAYLVTDSVTGEVVMVDAARSRGAIKAVVDNRFSVCELDWREVHALTKKNVRLIDAATGQSDEADDETEFDPAGPEPTPPNDTAVDQPESPGEGDGGLTAGENAAGESLFKRMSDISRQSEPEAANG